MSARRRFLLTWMAFSTLAIGAFGGIYLYYAIGARTGEFRARAELLAWQFADRVAFDLAQGRAQNLELLVRTLVLGNVLYAQVVREGRVLVEVSRLEGALPLAPAPDVIWQVERRTAGQQAYWDIRRALPDGEGYVRLGLALDPLENAIRVQVLLVAGISAALLALAGSITSYWARRVFAAPAPAPPPEQPVPVAPGAAPSQDQTCLRVGELAIDEVGKRVQIRGRPVELSPKEFELLRLLASRPGRVFSNREILAHAWTGSPLATAQDVKQYIYFLRQKLEENPKDPRLIVTVRGFGYKLQV